MCRHVSAFSGYIASCLLGTAKRKAGGVGGLGGGAEGDEAKEKESERSARLPAELAPPKPESQPKKARAHKKEKVPDSTKGKSRLARSGTSWQTTGMPVQTRHGKPSEFQKSRGSVGAIESLYW